jgi:hypothetical protein
MKVMKMSLLGLATLLVLGIFHACQKNMSSEPTTGVEAVGGKPAAVSLDAPTLACAGSTPASITLTVTAGASGAPAGFSVQWMLKSDYDLNGWSESSEPAGSFCKASLSGVPGDTESHAFNLGPNASVQVTIGDVLFD